MSGDTDVAAFDSLPQMLLQHSLYHLDLSGMRISVDIGRTRKHHKHKLPIDLSVSLHFCAYSENLLDLNQITQNHE